MKKRNLILIFLFLLVIFISACSSDYRCTKEAKICPGGSVVYRTGPNCDFGACPEVICAADAKECPDGSFVPRVAPDCNFRSCPPNNTYIFIGDQKISQLCVSDSDCKLIRKKYGYSCCYTGICEIYDYESSDFIAVNKAEFDEFRGRNCPSLNDCGPTPLCSFREVNTDIKARCIGGVCIKKSILSK